MNRLRVSQAANATSLAATTNYSFTADTHRAVSVQAVWTATTASFSIKLQCSNDDTTWDDFTAATAITDANGAVIWHLDSKDALYWRVNAVRTSGTLTTFKAYVANVAR